MCEKQVLQDPGHVDIVKACMHAILQGPTSYPRLNCMHVNTVNIIKLQSRF